MGIYISCKRWLFFFYATMDILAMQILVFFMVQLLKSSFHYHLKQPKKKKTCDTKSQGKVKLMSNWIKGFHNDMWFLLLHSFFHRFKAHS